jgi:1-acyl-sn-glycerol-3-phosphate acyltransferase
VLYGFLKYVAVGPLLRAIWRPWTEGLDNVPSKGAAILASNHLSFCDSFFMPVMVPRRVTFLAKSEYFTTAGLKGRLSRGFFRGVGQVPVDREDADAAKAALDTGVRILGEGHLLGIYPEGTRSPDGRLYRGKTGVARMALEARVPVIPCAMINTDIIQPTGRLVPHLRPRPGVRFGRPLDFSRYDGMAGDRFVERSMTDEIMYELMQLSGQVYVDIYAAKVKKAEGNTVAFGARPARRTAGRDQPGPEELREAPDRIPTEQAGRSAGRETSPAAPVGGQVADVHHFRRSCGLSRTASSARTVIPSTSCRSASWMRPTGRSTPSRRNSIPPERSTGSAGTCCRSCLRWPIQRGAAVSESGTIC